MGKGVHMVMQSVAQDIEDQIRFAVVLTAYWEETGSYPGSTEEFCTYLGNLRLTNEATFYREWTMTLDDRRCLSVQYTNAIGLLRKFELCESNKQKPAGPDPVEKSEAVPELTPDSAKLGDSQKN